MTDFDPYYEWLGIPPHERPITHWRLLGLHEGESNPKVIENAADRQMSFVRTYAAGERGKFATALLNEISQARVVLLNEERRAAYQREMGPKASATARPLAVGFVPFEPVEDSGPIDPAKVPPSAIPGRLPTIGPAMTRNAPPSGQVLRAPPPIPKRADIPVPARIVGGNGSPNGANAGNGPPAIRPPGGPPPMFRADEKDSNTPIQAILLPASGPVPIQKGKPADLHQMIAADLKAYEQAGVSEKAANAHLRKAWKARGQDWTRAMELDWPEGVFFVARCMQLGFGVPKDETAAADLLHKAAVRGLAVAQDALGHCYARGIGVEKEPRRAARCFHEAAKQGHAGAQYELGVVFERGLGVAMNLKQAAIWYRKAAKQGHLQAEEAFVRVRDKK